MSDKKIFQNFLYYYIGKIILAPWRQCFLSNHDGLKNLGRGSPKEHFCQIIFKSVQWFLTRKIFNVFYIDLGKISTAPWRPCFLTNHDGFNNLGSGSLKEIFLPIIYWNRSSGFWKEDFYCFFFFFFFCFFWGGGGGGGRGGRGGLWTILNQYHSKIIPVKLG